jgi:hypothetical protein
VALGALLVAAPWSARGQTVPAPAPGCHILDGTFAARPAPTGTVVVPVIVHYMALDVSSVPPGTHFDAADNHVSEVFAPANRKALEALFAPPAAGATPKRRNVNHVWEPFGVRLAIVRTERCGFTWAEVGKVPVPAPKPADLALLRKMARRFNAPGFHGVDLYQWPKIGSSIGGYGSTPRADGAFPGPGAVWFHVPTLSDTEVGEPPNPRSVVLTMAHEVGHFFTLTHTCSFRRTDEPQLPDCPEPGTSGMLMSAFADGIGLSDCEKRKARQGVTKVLQGTPISTEEEIACPVPGR